MSRPLVFDKGFVSKCSGEHEGPGTCPGCRRELVPRSDPPPRYCDRRCREVVAKLPRPERDARRAATPAGTCVNCGSAIPNPYRCTRARNASIKIWRANAGGRLRFGPDAFAWLAEKLGVDAADERLPSIALELGKAGKLAVLVDDGVVVGIAKPKDRP